MSYVLQIHLDRIVCRCVDIVKDQFFCNIFVFFLYLDALLFEYLKYHRSLVRLKRKLVGKLFKLSHFHSLAFIQSGYVLGFALDLLVALNFLFVKLCLFFFHISSVFLVFALGKLAHHYKLRLVVFFAVDSLYQILSTLLLALCDYPIDAIVKIF